MKNNVCIQAIFLLALCGCGQSKDDKNGVSTSLIEKSIKAASGNKLDAMNVDDIEKNNALVDVTVDGENLQAQFKNGFGSITASKETLAITISGGENGQDNILIGFLGKDLTTLRPISGKMTNGENDGFTFSIMKAVENGGVETWMSFEAEGEIIKLQKDKTIIKVKGKIGLPTDVETPEKWKVYEGTVTLNFPVFQALGSSKEDFIY
ncbi:hypothetical protein [Pedobacter insulae]|uniref:Lipoprotein n=1 Tax=Pedobacter insulae TaxID=414048 RepID=A0A1I2XG53_9SPHI|nr:hypothetical protein [Pedobacter insulae]SFH12480.1 hypothetical protein SAMN04489864_105224 [Pedobacter insulae]